MESADRAEADTHRERDLAQAHGPTQVRRSDAMTPVGAPRQEPAAPAVEPGFAVGQTSQSQDPVIGTIVGEYRVVERIGAGGMGIVYRAVHPIIGKSVAVKILRAELGANPREMERFIEEARTASAIGNRAIVDVFGCGQLEVLGSHYLVMEYLDGEPLSALMRDGGAMREDEGLALLEEIATGLAAAHKAGVIHRDLKPSNIFIVRQADGGRYVKLLDFGLAKRAAAPNGSIVQTRDLVSGTVGYMAPEQARAERIGPRSDLYSLGVIAYELFAGASPFSATSLVALIMAHERETPRPLQELAPHLRLDVCRLIHQLLAKLPADRPASAEVLAQALRDLRAGKVPEVPRVPRSKAVPALVLGGIAALCAVGAGLFLRNRNTPEPVPEEADVALPSIESPPALNVVPAVMPTPPEEKPAVAAPLERRPSEAATERRRAAAPVRRKAGGDAKLLEEIRQERVTADDAQYLLLLNAAETKALAGDPEAGPYFRELRRKFGR